MLRIIHPPGRENERQYILNVILRRFLGLDFRVETGNSQQVSIRCDEDPNGRELVLDDTLFHTSVHRWLTVASLPQRPCSRFEVPFSDLPAILLSPSLPVVYGRLLPNGSYLSLGTERIELGLDILGSAFFMLSRYEEIVKTERDERGRFPKEAALAFQEGFLERPLINEYVELLWSCLKRLWPELQRSRREYRLCLGHDLDVPLLTGGQSLWEVLRGFAGDLLKRRNPALAAGRIRSMISGSRGRWDEDIGNTFDFIMDTSEHIGQESTFFFITDHSGGKIDGTYQITDPWIRQLIRKINQRGHHFALHPSFETYNSQTQMEKEFERLKRALAEEGIHQDRIGGRQHYLRWEAPTTWQLYEDVGLAYDATLTFPDACGFRCGTCYEFPVFNAKTGKPLQLMEEPLIVMEKTLLDTSRVSEENVRQTILRLQHRCQMFNGSFSLLWHNSWLITPKEKELYLQVLGVQGPTRKRMPT
jgi:hypothetical protein